MTLEGEELVSRAVHGDGFRISTPVRDKVVKEKTSVLVRDLTQDEAFRMQHSISEQQIQTMMAVRNKIVNAYEEVMRMQI